MKAIATWFGLLLGAGALLLQFSLTIPARLAQDDPLVSALVFFFSFFTILSNLALVLVYASELWPRHALSWFRRPLTRGMMVALIILVMVFYHLLLAPAWSPEGLFRVADVLLHYATPVFYVVWWVLFMRHGTLKFGDIPRMLLPPTIYLVYVMLRGALISQYPYPILEANRLGYAAVTLNVLGVLVGLTALCAAVIAIDRLLTRIDLPGP